MAESVCKIALENSPEGKTELVLEGYLSIDKAAKIYDELLPMAGNSDIECIRVRNVLNIDLVAIQMLAAFVKSQKIKGRNIEFAFELDDQLSELLGQAGISDMMQSIAMD
ncbi:MAG: hypothetical protein K9H64_17865 [Bacteroidales bacterium]|nr:hypothetical protein [Bacteroidales bacterium]MCF8457888.1 hypothetical protein [Bacteroidales bacterium]